MYKKMQRSGVTEIIPLMCTSPPWSQYPVFSQPEGLPLMTAGWQGFLFPSWVPSRLTLGGGWNCWWLWQPLFINMAGKIYFLVDKTKLVTSLEKTTTTKKPKKNIATKQWEFSKHALNVIKNLNPDGSEGCMRGLMGGMKTQTHQVQDHGIWEKTRRSI